MANVLAELFFDIAEAIREKNGETGVKYSPSEFPEKIANISGGGADVRYVTFMSHDGTVELGKKAVAVGDDCADPIARGVFDTPTKESTTQYNYFYIGWADTANSTIGTYNANALKAVTEDRTVYAAFRAETRRYTISYYDGDTLLKSESLAYGAMPSYSPTKDGFGFSGWNPELTAVTGDANYTAVWAEAITFANGSWADIAAISESGEAESYFSVGDTKTITVGGTNLDLVIIGFAHDTLSGSTEKAGMTVMAKGLLSDTTTAVTNWTSLASFMKNTIKAQLPSELQAVIKSVSKPCDSTQVSAAVTPSNVAFDLFPLSMDEMCIRASGTRKYTDSDWRNMITELGTPYAYFLNAYSSTWFGPYSGTFPGSTSGSILKGAWLRQYSRFNEIKYVYYNVSLSTSSKKWTATESPATARKVMFAFCI